MPASPVGIRSLLRPSGRGPGICMESWRWSRRKSLCGHHFSTTTSCGPCFARRNRPSLAASDISLRMIADGKTGILLNIPTDRGLGGNRSRLSESVSRALLEFLFKAEYGYDMGMPQWVARVDQTPSPLSAWKGSSLDDIRFSISVRGTGTHSPTTYRKSCLIHEVFPGPTSIEKVSKPWCEATSKATGIIP